MQYLSKPVVVLFSFLGIFYFPIFLIGIFFTNLLLGLVFPKFEMKIINANSVRMSWNTDLLHGASPNDMISWVFLFPDTKTVIHRQNCISRDAGSIGIELPFKKSNQTLHCWAYLSLHNTYLFSPASYLQITDLQSKLTDKK